jgi:hypothetical protein
MMMIDLFCHVLQYLIYLHIVSILSEDIIILIISYTRIDSNQQKQLCFVQQPLMIKHILTNSTLYEIYILKYRLNNIQGSYAKIKLISTQKVPTLGYRLQVKSSE